MATAFGNKNSASTSWYLFKTLFSVIFHQAKVTTTITEQQRKNCPGKCENKNAGPKNAGTESAGLKNAGLRKAEPVIHVTRKRFVKAKFHYASWFELVRSWSQTGSKLDGDQLRTSFEPASVMEFGFYSSRKVLPISV